MSCSKIVDVMPGKDDQVCKAIVETKKGLRNFHIPSSMKEFTVSISAIRSTATVGWNKDPVHDLVLLDL